MSNIKFSLIVPVYNTKQSFLIEALNSLCDQDYDNYEIIIVDDGSNQETKDLLNNYKNNKKVKIKHQKNQGQMASRLNGVNYSTGDYIIFIDSDDYIKKDFLCGLNNIIQINNVDVVMYDSNRFINNVNNIVDSPHGFFKNGVVSKDDVMIQLLSFHISAMWDKCIKKSIINTNINNETISFRNGEDLEQSTNIILNANSFYYSDSIKYYYRVNEENREYYDVTNLKDINFPVATFKNVFNQNSKYLNYLSIFKTSCIKSITRTTFLVFKYNKSKRKIINLLDELNKQEISILIRSINISSSSLIYDLLFKFITERRYYILNVLSIVYNLFFQL